MNHRIMFGLTAVVLTAGAAAQSACAQSDPPRPNIVVVMVDDMGYSDVGSFGGEIETPHLDRLAEEGVRFTQFYNTTKCFTTRASLLTGLYPHEVGSGHRAWQPMRGGVTIAEVLRAAGYRTFFAGKWHLGETPSARGFDRTFGFTSRGILTSYFDPSVQGPKMPWSATESFEASEWDIDGTIHPFYKPEDPDFYATDAFTDRAIEWIGESGEDGRPFFLYLAYNAPHWPLQAPPEDIAKYRETYALGWDRLREARHRRQIELGIIDPATPLPPRAREVVAWEEVEEKNGMSEQMAVHAAMMDRVDQNVGRLMRTLAERGLEENTLVLFLSDNGADRLEHRGAPEQPIGSAYSFDAFGPGWANLSDTPWRRYKGESFEGGISTPLIAYWPAGVRNPGRISGAMGHVIDLMATAVDAAGATYPATFRGEQIRPTPGKSLLPVLRGQTEALHDTLYFEWSRGRAVRQGRWKLVLPNGPGAGADPEWELYDIEADRVEMHDLADRYPERVREMKDAWEAWARSVGVEGID